MAASGDGGGGMMGKADPEKGRSREGEGSKKLWGHQVHETFFHFKLTASVVSQLVVVNG